jgi:hypothetical protein
MSKIDTRDYPHADIEDGAAYVLNAGNYIVSPCKIITESHDVWEIIVYKHAWEDPCIFNASYLGDVEFSNYSVMTREHFDTLESFRERLTQLVIVGFD